MKYLSSAVFGALLASWLPYLNHGHCLPLRASKNPNSGEKLVGASAVCDTELREGTTGRTVMPKEDVSIEAAAAEKAPYWDPPPAPVLDTSELQKWSLYRALIAEFVATLIFLYVSIATVIGYKAQSNNLQTCTGVGFLGVSWSFGATIFILVYCTGGVSGTTVHYCSYLYSCRRCRNEPVSSKLSMHALYMQAGTSTRP